MKSKRGILSIFLRYLLILLLALNGLWLFYTILTPITLKISYFILKLILPTSFAISISNNAIISLSGHSIELVKACIAGSAYYLIVILNLSTPLSLKKRKYTLLISLASLFIINNLRIAFFSMLFIYNKIDLFNQLHLFFWYFLSIVFVLLIHLTTFKIFKIKEIPIYSDFQYIKKTYKN